jgi:hypothetical protein
VTGGNYMVLVCKPCQQAGEDDFGLKLAVRTKLGYYEAFAPIKEADKWYAHHRKCGKRGEPDHFALGYSHGQNHDQRELESTVREILA